MAIPVFLALSLVRTSIGMKTSAAAGELNITHGFLSACEDFEKVPEHDQLVGKDTILSETIEKFLKKYGLQSKDMVIKTICKKIIKQSVSDCLIRDKIFHLMVPFLEPELLSGTTYGTLFSVMLKYFKEDCSNNKLHLMKTADPITNRLLSHTMEKQWGKHSIRRKTKKFYPEITYEALDKENFIGIITEPMGDIRKIFWLAESYQSKRQLFAYLFFYILLKSFNIKFITQSGNLKGINKYKSLPYFKTLNLKPDLNELENVFIQKKPMLEQYLTDGAVDFSKPCALDCENTDCDFFVLQGFEHIKEIYIVYRSFFNDHYHKCIREAN